MKFWYAEPETWGRMAAENPSSQSRFALTTRSGSRSPHAVSRAISNRESRWTKAVAAAGTRFMAPPQANTATPPPSWLGAARPSLHPPHQRVDRRIGQELIGVARLHREASLGDVVEEEVLGLPERPIRDQLPGRRRRAEHRIQEVHQLTSGAEVLPQSGYGGTRSAAGGGLRRAPKPKPARELVRRAGDHLLQRPDRVARVAPVPFELVDRHARDRMNPELEAGVHPQVAAPPP